MGFHTFDSDRADKLEDPTRFAYCSVDELLALVGAPAELRVAEIGSGTGFYTDEIAPYLSAVHAVDVQAAMHDRYRAKGVPENVELVTAEAADLPFADGELDAVVSTFTYHEFASESALAELARVLDSGGHVGIADWSAEGLEESGPPTSERFAATDAVDAFETAGFAVDRADERRETFVLAGRAP
ncbi:class I SAM-dependent methyltransferase [Halorarius halobius]|uniref:class I SAM-dependent methyltransferase n=1 Tax=Halorarius halobius TaxID=2962671 RepID=UPI0020CF150D|nr:class I SAM-dependent methyltransferase [Halorarius halobius]